MALGSPPQAVPTAGALHLRDYVPNPGLLGNVPFGTRASNPLGSLSLLWDRDGYYGASVALQRLIRPPVLRTVRAISA